MKKINFRYIFPGYIFLFSLTSSMFAQEVKQTVWPLEYKGIKVQSSPSKKIGKEDIEIDIGEPFIIAAKDDSPNEGNFTAPTIYNFNGVLYVNWSFDWDVVDANLPDVTSGRISYDGGLTWEKNKHNKTWGATPLPGYKWQTGANEISAYTRDGFEIPGKPGYYKVPFWKSFDNGQTWGKTEWTKVKYPGTKGLDIYNNPPEIYKEKDRNYTRGGTKPEPPEYLKPFFSEVSANRGPGIYPVGADNEGNIYSMIPSRMLNVKNSGKIKDWEKEYWEKLNWDRYAILLQVSKDNGRTWKYKGVVANGSDYENEIDFYPGDGFTEPSLAVYPDGEMVCVMRTGHFKPLYITRSRDKGKTWSKPQLLLSEGNKSIHGVKPTLVLLENQVLVLSTGRPDVTVHFSKDRGNSWFGSEILYTVGLKKPGELSFPGKIEEIIYANSHLNVRMAPAGENKVLVVHDATRRDESAVNDWLKKHGHGLVIGRIISVKN